MLQEAIEKVTTFIEHKKGKLTKAEKFAKIATDESDLRKAIYYYVNENSLCPAHYVIQAERIGLGLSWLDKDWSTDEENVQAGASLYKSYSEKSNANLIKKLISCRETDDGKGNVTIDKPITAQMIAHILRSRRVRFTPIDFKGGMLK